MTLKQVTQTFPPSCECRILVAHLADAQRCATACITVHLGDNGAGDLDLIVKGLHQVGSFLQTKINRQRLQAGTGDEQST